MSQERKFDKFVKPLAPEFLLTEEGPYREVKNKVVKRFNSPAAQLIRLPSSFDLKEYYSLDIFKPEEAFENEVEGYKNRHERLMFIYSCSLRYVGSRYVVYLTTALLPPLTPESIHFIATENTYSQTTDGANSVRKITFSNGTDAMLFNNALMKDGRNQLVFIKDEKYYISIASDMDVEEIIKLIEENLVVE